MCHNLNQFIRRQQRGRVTFSVTAIFTRLTPAVVLQNTNRLPVINKCEVFVFFSLIFTVHL